MQIAYNNNLLISKPLTVMHFNIYLSIHSFCLFAREVYSVYLSLLFCLFKQEKISEELQSRIDGLEAEHNEALAREKVS